VGARRHYLSLAVLIALLAACAREAVDRRSPVVESLSPPANGALALPNALTSVKFAIIGDSGRGTPEQHQVARQMVRYRERFKFNFVLMVGDNIYEGPATAEDYRLKFEEPYAALLENSVKFFAVLGNHDDPRQVSYPPFNMKGERYYSFEPKSRGSRNDSPRHGRPGKSCSCIIPCIRRAAIETRPTRIAGRSSRSSSGMA
jgi:hypothetical protein